MTPTDATGAALRVGDRVMYLNNEKSRIDPEFGRDCAGKVVTVRAVKHTAARREIRVDDGDPANPDLFSNGYGWSAWLAGETVAKLPTVATASTP